MLPSSPRSTVVLVDLPGPMHTSSVAAGTAPVDQFFAVSHWLSPAAPVHVLVQVTRAPAGNGPSGEVGNDSSGTMRTPAVRRPSHENALRLPLARHPILIELAPVEGPCHPFHLRRQVALPNPLSVERDAGLIGPSAKPK